LQKEILHLEFSALKENAQMIHNKKYTVKEMKNVQS
jgi:hypothetical protein